MLYSNLFLSPHILNTTSQNIYSLSLKALAATEIKTKLTCTGPHCCFSSTGSTWSPSLDHTPCSRVDPTCRHVHWSHSQWWSWSWLHQSEPQTPALHCHWEWEEWQTMGHPWWRESPCNSQSRRQDHKFQSENTFIRQRTKYKNFEGCCMQDLSSAIACKVIIMSNLKNNYLHLTISTLSPPLPDNIFSHLPTSWDFIGLRYTERNSPTITKTRKLCFAGIITNSHY